MTCGRPHGPPMGRGGALFAIDYAFATLEEAEYAVVDAILARLEATSWRAS
jgi:hypothetical protein